MDALPTLSQDDWRVETRAGLTLLATTRGESAVFDAFFAGYDRAFVLPDEKEDADGIRACLAQNHGEAHASLVQRYGEFREVCLIAVDSAVGARVGGANFIAMPEGDVVTANLNYLFIDETARGRGNFRRLLSAVTELIAGFFPGVRRSLVFLEQNDPFAMSADAYARDSEFTGLDQFDRLRIWAKAGARVVDFAYVQPPLSAEQEADETLIYSVLGADAPSISSCLLHAHLKRFFGISVLKGAQLDEEPTTAAQLAALSKACAANEPIALLDPAPLLARMRSHANAQALGAPSFRAALSKRLTA